MSTLDQDQKQQAGIYSNIRSWLLPTKNKEAKSVLVFSDMQTAEEMFSKVKELSMNYWAQTEYADVYTSIKSDRAAVAALGLDDEDDPDSFIIEPRYNTHQLEILEDCYVSDPVINASINKLVYVIVGPHGKTVLDSRKEFSVEQDRRNEINSIVGNSKYAQAKTQVDKLFITESISFYSSLIEFLTNWLLYGRAAWYIVYDNSVIPALESKPEIEVEQGMYTMTQPWKSLILLDSRRIGRVKVNKETLQVTHIEYLDCEINENTGESRPAIFNTSSTSLGGSNRLKAAWFEVGRDVIYWPYTSGAAGRNSRFVGYSRIESIVHMSQVKRIIMNKNVKEAAETHYMGVGRVQFDPNTPDALIINFINSMKNAMGKWFGHKIPVTVTVEKMNVDLEKYEPLIDLINRELLRCIGLPSFLLGYEQIANYANSEQILLAARETDIHPLRARLKDFIQMKILDPLFKYYLSNPNSPMQIQAAVAAASETETNTKSKIIDEDVKLTYEMEDVSFSTKPELAEFYFKLHAIIPSLPFEAILRGVGMDNWVEEVQAAEEKRLQQEETQQNMEMQMQQAELKMIGQKKPAYPGINRGAVASADIITTNPEVKAAILKTEEMKQKLYEQILKKHAQS